MVSKKAKQRNAETYKGRTSPLPKDHIGHLDLRVGEVRELIPNPNASHKYYFITVNFGDIYSKIVQAMLVHHYTEEQLIGQMVVCCCNIRTAWSKGLDSNTSIMIASSSDMAAGFELLHPPESAVPGDIITIPDYPRDPDTPYLDPNAGIWESIMDQCKVNDRGEVLYRSKKWIVAGEPGHVHTDKLVNSIVRVV